MRRWIAVISLATMGMGTGAVSAQVYLRGQAEPFDGEVLSVSAEGVGVRAGQGSKTISWDRVREVRGDRGTEAVSFAATADRLWRARTRLERGDFASAEPLFDGLVDKARGTTGPTSSVVFEGLLRCRLKRGAQIAAVWAWLDWIKARAGMIEKAGSPAAAWIGGRIEGSAELDEETGLMIALPPVFLRDAALDAGAGSEEWGRYETAGSGPGADLAMLYRAAARFEAGMAPELRALKTSTASVRLVSEIVRARVGEDAERKEAREALAARLTAKEIEPWVECWCHVGIGRSLVREQDSELRRQGVIHMLHAPARFVRISSGLAALALAESAVTLRELGDDAGAEAIKGELIDRFPRSAAIGWPRLREVRMKGEAAAPVAGTTKDSGANPSAQTPASKPQDRRPR